MILFKKIRKMKSDLEWAIRLTDKPRIITDKISNINIMWYVSIQEDPNTGFPRGWCVDKYRFRATKTKSKIHKDGRITDKIWDKQFQRDELWKAIAYKWYYMTCLNPKPKDIGSVAKPSVKEEEEESDTLLERLQNIETQNTEILQLLKTLQIQHHS
tara:strand:+ start:1743 stop:2213 length:471 start_codon:yes stop_codon:yes gene_type:complete